MNSKFVHYILALALIAGTAGLLNYTKAHQKLGAPGVKVVAVPMLNTNGAVASPQSVPMSENVPGYSSVPNGVTKAEYDVLPKDTTWGRRVYTPSNGTPIYATVVLMGNDRTSIHQPELCLTAQGWKITKSEVISVPMSRPRAYSLPVMKLTTSLRAIDERGMPMAVSGVYLYWFVSEDKLTAMHSARVWSILKVLLSRGVLERWAYISYMVPCAPGTEDAATESAIRLIQATVPEFQLVAGAPAR